MNSTPSRCSSIMRFTALPPPPPTPTTFMRAFCEALSSNSKIIARETPLLRRWETGRPADGRLATLDCGEREGCDAVIASRPGVGAPAEYNAFSPPDHTPPNSVRNTLLTTELPKDHTRLPDREQTVMAPDERGTT